MKYYRVGSNQFKKKPRFTVTQQLGTIVFSSFVLMGVLNIVFPTQIDASDTNSVMLSPIADPAESMRVVEKMSTPAATLITKPLTREDKVKAYLEERNSPLAPYAGYIVEMADRYDIPWTLSVSIAHKESSLETAGNTTDYNAWGIMTWDDKGTRSIREFKSWRESIKYHAALISKSYRENMNKAIQVKYCPSFECSDTWTKDVTRAQKEINSL